MKTSQKKNLYINRIYILLTVLFGGCFSNAQNISVHGPSYANQGDELSYWVDLDGLDLHGPDIEEAYWSIANSNGEIINVFNDGESVTVKWTVAGTQTLRFNVDTYVIDPYKDEMDINVVGPELPISNPTVLSLGCGQATLSISGTPPSAVTWFWQGKNASGTSTAEGSGSAYIATQGSGTYYIRARNNSGAWSSSSKSIYVPMLPIPIWYEDQDGDGLGDPNSSINDCNKPNGFVSNSDDLCPTSSNEALLSDENYIYVTRYKNAYTENEAGCVSAAEKIEAVTYYDGLGRSKQIIGIATGGNGEDIVTHVTYDGFGRQDKDYLPYAAAANGGFYRTGAEVATDSFYSSTKYENTLNPFSEKNLEASPLGRVLEQGAPGADWAVDINSDTDHTIKFEYGTNTGFDYIRKFGVNLPSGSPQLVSEGFYTVNELYKTITKDENWQPYQEFFQEHTTEEYKDKQGRVVLKRTFEKQSWLNTYYVYDDYGNLTYVLPPKSITINTNENLYSGIEEFSNDSFIMGTSKGFTFNIGYQMLPSGQLHILNSGKITNFSFTPPLPDMILGNFMGLDLNDSPVSGALVYIQNGDVYLNSTGVGLKANSYGELDYFVDVDISNYVAGTINAAKLYGLCYQYKYDGRNRLIEKKIPGKDKEYIIYNKLDQPILTQDANLRAQNKWLFTKYDVFGRVAYTGEYINTTDTTREAMELMVNAVSTLWETKQSNSINSTPVNYTNDAFPDDNSINVFTINYYDDYDFYGSSLPIISGGADLVNYDNTDKLKTKGLTTWDKVKVLGTPNWITTVSGYDAKGRAIYVKSVNDYLTTTDIVQNTLDFTGKVDKTETSHVRGTTSIITEDLFTYDHVGRLKKQTQELNNTNVLEVIVENSYDELGQLENKGVGGKPTQGRLQNVDYSYNIRGWLKQINDPTDLGDKLFAFKLNYNTVDHYTASPFSNTGVPLYNGNIAETEWRTANTDSNLKWYRYKYDALNRITQALDNVPSYVLYDVKYDKNGNIDFLSRYGYNETSGSPGWIDRLTYTYGTDSNQLLKVVDGGTANDKVFGFKDGTNSGNDYTYDTNGNMLKDLNKGIGSATTNGIAYNHLNLPKQVIIDDGGSNKGTISYIYDATGTKLEKKVEIEGVPNPLYTYYAGNYVYEGSFLKFFSHPEGYVDAENGYKYVYQYKDHLGNIRLSYSDLDNDGDIDVTTNPMTNEILEENSYYPFGLKHKGYNNNPTSSNIALKFGFQEQELNDELGLNWHSYKYRNYDAAIGRFFNIDPLTEDYTDWGPYVFSGNRVIDAREIEGLEPAFTSYKPERVEYTNVRPLDAYLKNKVKSGELSAPEASFIAQNKSDSYAARDNKGIASRFAANAGLPKDIMNPNNNDATDAVRHALWSALNTQTSGEEFARGIGVAHEEGNFYGMEQMGMDLVNNEVGIALALANPNADVKELVTLLIDMVANGELLVINPSTGQIEKSNLSTQDAQKSKNKVGPLYEDGDTDSYDDEEDTGY